jgi:hypothetical protein
MPLSNADAQAIAARARDPFWFIEHVLGLQPTAAARAYGYTSALTPDQQAIVASVRDHRRTAVPAGHGVGKTNVVALLVLWFLYTNPGCKVVTTAPTWFQVENLLWQEIRGAHDRSRTPLGGTPNLTSLTLGEQWFAVGLSTDKPDRFQGTHAPRIMVVFDEATGVAPMIWDAAEGLAVGAADRFIAIGNPTDPASRFKQVCDSGRWQVIPVSCVNHPNVIHDDPRIIPGAVTKQWVDEHLEDYGGPDSPLARARILGKWPEQGADSLIALGWVEAAQARWPGTTGLSLQAVGCDVARFGSDATVLQPLYYDHIAGTPQIRQGQDTMATTGELAATYAAAPVPLAVDDTGVGSGVTDRLHEQGIPALPVNFGSAAWQPERFVNRRAEMYWSLREALRNNELALPPDAKLQAELTNIKYRLDSRGRYQIEAKDEIRKRLGRSPDRADALALAVWAPIEAQLQALTRETVDTLAVERVSLSGWDR